MYHARFAGFTKLCLLCSTFLHADKYRLRPTTMKVCVPLQGSSTPVALLEVATISIRLSNNLYLYIGGTITAAQHHVYTHTHYDTLNDVLIINDSP